MSDESSMPEARIIEFVRTLTDGNSGELQIISPETDLLKLGLIDSFNIIEIATFLERDFDVRINSDDLRLENFANARTLAGLVRRLRSPGKEA